MLNRSTEKGQKLALVSPQQQMYSQFVFVLSIHHHAKAAETKLKAKAKQKQDESSLLSGNM